MTTPRKERKREARREQKAEQAAVLDKVVLFIFYRFIASFLFCAEHLCISVTHVIYCSAEYRKGIAGTPQKRSLSWRDSQYYPCCQVQ